MLWEIDIPYEGISGDVIIIRAFDGHLIHHNAALLLKGAQGLCFGRHRCKSLRQDSKVEVHCLKSPR